jgi:CubicO group peptidase (beta-lactamase class C family)
MLIVLLSMWNCKKSDNNLVYNRNYINEIKEVREEIVIFMARNSIPGGSFAIAKDGKIIYSEAMGYASKDLEVAATRQTKFRIGPVTELFTSLAYQRLIEDGILHPDSSVQNYYPDFPEKEYIVTLDNLVNHVSGIRAPYSSEEADRGLSKGLKDGLNMFINDPLDSPPNVVEELSMFNYMLLGAAMEKATGKSFDNIITEQLLDTLHLENTVFENPYKSIKNRSDHFEHNILSQITEGMSSDLRFIAPDKGLLSNAEDLVKLGNALLESDYITPSMKERLFTLKMLDNGFQAQLSNGWFIGKASDGNTFYARTGGVTGGGAAISIYPEHNLVVAVAINLTLGSDNIPVFKMASPFLPIPKEESSENEEVNMEN